MIKSWDQVHPSSIKYEGISGFVFHSGNRKVAVENIAANRPSGPVDNEG